MLHNDVRHITKRGNNDKDGEAKEFGWYISIIKSGNIEFFDVGTTTLVAAQGVYRRVWNLLQSQRV